MPETILWGVDSDKLDVFYTQLKLFVDEGIVSKGYASKIKSAVKNGALSTSMKEACIQAAKQLDIPCVPFYKIVLPF